MRIIILDNWVKSEPPGYLGGYKFPMQWWIIGIKNLYRQKVEARFPGNLVLPSTLEHGT